MRPTVPLRALILYRFHHLRTPGSVTGINNEVRLRGLRGCFVQEEPAYVLVSTPVEETPGQLIAMDKFHISISRSALSGWTMLNGGRKVGLSIPFMIPRGMFRAMSTDEMLFLANEYGGAPVEEWIRLGIEKEGRIVKAEGKIRFEGVFKGNVCGSIRHLKVSEEPPPVQEIQERSQSGEEEEEEEPLFRVGVRHDAPFPKLVISEGKVKKIPQYLQERILRPVKVLTLEEVKEMEEEKRRKGGGGPLGRKVIGAKKRSSFLRKPVVEDPSRSELESGHGEQGGEASVDREEAQRPVAELTCPEERAGKGKRLSPFVRPVQECMFDPIMESYQETERSIPMGHTEDISPQPSHHPHPAMADPTRPPTSRPIFRYVSVKDREPQLQKSHIRWLDSDSLPTKPAKNFVLPYGSRTIVIQNPEDSAPKQSAALEPTSTDGQTTLAAEQPAENHEAQGVPVAKEVAFRTPAIVRPGERAPSTIVRPDPKPSEQSAPPVQDPIVPPRISHFIAPALRTSKHLEWLEQQKRNRENHRAAVAREAANLANVPIGKETRFGNGLAIKRYVLLSTDNPDPGPSPVPERGAPTIRYHPAEDKPRGLVWKHYIGDP